MALVKMELVSSDTNIWIDFALIDKLELPFKLPYTYIMYEEMIDSEVVYPDGIKDDLLRLGLTPVDLSSDEVAYTFYLADKYISLSRYDRIALAIAKIRNIVLLTGDKDLRNVAVKEDVEVIGTIGLLDKLYEGEHIDEKLYVECLSKLYGYDGQQIRLPKQEIEYRLAKFK